MNIRLTATILLVITLAFTPPLSAGDLDPPASPDDAGSAMYTIEDIYQRMVNGTQGAPRGAGFQEPAGAPDATMHNLSDVMNAAPAKDSTDGATAEDVIDGKTFWGLTDGEWGLQTGTLPPPFYGVGPEHSGEYIDNITVTGGSTLGGDTVTVTGNFVTDGKTVAITSGGVTIDPGDITLIQNNQIEFTSPAGTGSALDIVLEIDSVAIDHQVLTQIGYAGSVTFSYDPPVITSVSGCTDNPPATEDCGIAAEPVITITGNNFGATVGDISVTVDGRSCGSVSLTVPHTEIECSLPLNASGGQDMDVTVTANGLSGTQPYVSYAGPTLTPGTIDIVGDGTPGTSVDLPDTAGGQVVEMYGSNLSGASVMFGPPGTDFDDKPYALTSVSGTSTRIQGTVPAGVQGTGLVFQVRTGSQISKEGTDVVNFPAPVIAANTLRQAPETSGCCTSLVSDSSFGKWVYFDVDNLCSEPSFIQVNYGPSGGPYPYNCSQVSLYDADTIKCWINGGIGTDYVFVVEIWGNSSAEGTDTFSFASGPTVDGISSSACFDVGNTTINCPTLGNAQITVTGTNFGTDAEDLEVYVGTEPANHLMLDSPTQLKFILGPGTGSQPVTVQRGRLSSYFAGQLALSYVAPSLTAISGCTEDPGETHTTYLCPSEGGTVITLEGSNLGATGGGLSGLIGIASTA